MALAKINLTVKSTVKNEDDPIHELISENASGYMKYTAEEGVVHLAYKTATESGAVETRIEIYGRDVRLIRTGAIESNFLLSEGTEHFSVYKIPPFEFDLSVVARQIDNRLTIFGGTLTLSYEMCIGGAKKTCNMQLIAAPV